MATLADLDSEGGGGRHRRSHSRGLIDNEIVVVSEASLGGHRRQHSRGLIVETSDEQNSSHRKKDDGQIGDIPSGNVADKSVAECWERIKQKHPGYDHYSPNTWGVLFFTMGFFLIFCAVGVLAWAIDCYLVPGFRMIPIGA